MKTQTRRAKPKKITTQKWRRTMSAALDNSFLPDGMEEVQKKGKYFNIGKRDVPDGEYRIRIVQKTICGWTEFDSIEKKSYRYRPSQKPKKPRDPSQSISRFWAAYIWNYDDSSLQVATFNQNSIISSLERLAVNPEWGNYTKYDILITKNAKEKKYTVTPCPHRSLPLEAQKALKQEPVRLEALYDNGNPWTDLEPDGLDEIIASSNTADAAHYKKLEALIDRAKPKSIELVANLCKLAKVQDWHDLDDMSLGELQERLETLIHVKGV